MTTSVPPTNKPTVYQPRAEQLERDAALRRFNRLYVALPITLIVIAALLIVALFIYLIFSPNTNTSTLFLSNLADIITILAIIPMMVMCAIVPLAYVAFVANQRQKRKQNPRTGPMADRSRVQATLWRIDNGLDTVKTRTEETAPKIAKPFIDFNARVAHFDKWQKNLRDQSEHED